MVVDKVGWGMLSAVSFPTTRAWFVSLQRRRILARTRLSDICGALAGEERMVESCQARSKVCHEPCHRSTERSLPRRAGVCPKASWSV